MCCLLSFMSFADLGPAWGGGQVLVRMSSAASDSQADDFCQADLSFTLSAPSVCWKFNMGTFLEATSFSSFLKKEESFLETNKVLSYIACELFLFLLQRLVFAGVGNVFSYSHLFQINIMTFTEAVITLVRDASNLGIFDLSSTWGEDCECIFFFPTLCICNSV